MSSRAVAKVRPTTPAPQRPRLLLALMLVVSVLLVWAFLPWQWSLVDDADYRLNLLTAQDDHGWWGGIVARVEAGYDYDRSGGQFRPFLWVYSATFYLLEPGPAHAVRLLLLLLVLGCIGLLVRRRVDEAARDVPAWMLVVWGVAAVAAVRGLYDGLSFLSIMELPAVAFVIAAAVDRSARRKIGWLVVGSLCKTPVVGGLFMLAVVLYRRKQRLLAVIAAAAGVVIVVFAHDFALGGSYTADYQLTLANAQATVVGLARQLALPAIVLCSALLWVRTWRPRLDGDVLILAAAGAGYVLLLLPWGSSSGYNLAAPAALLVAAGVLAMPLPVGSSDSDPPPRNAPNRPDALPRPRGAAAVHVLPVAAAAAAAVFVATLGLTAAFERDATIRGVVEWADALPADEVVGTNGIESSVRFAQLLVLHDDSAAPRFVYVAPDGAAACRYDWVVVLHDQGPAPNGVQLENVRALPLGDIYRVAGAAGPASSC